MMESVRAESRDHARSTQIGIACELRRKPGAAVPELTMDGGPRIRAGLGDPGFSGLHHPAFCSTGAAYADLLVVSGDGAGQAARPGLEQRGQVARAGYTSGPLFRASINGRAARCPTTRRITGGRSSYPANTKAPLAGVHNARIGAPSKPAKKSSAAANGGSCMHLPRVLLTVRHNTIHHRADCASDIGACGADQRPNGPPCPHR